MSGLLTSMQCDTQYYSNWQCDAGKLANGMTYYCRQNSQPRNRAELRVAIKVGSLQESEHERGIAHLIEVSVHVAIKMLSEA
jgi:predicted Zn-dependent peptidase